MFGFYGERNGCPNASTKVESHKTCLKFTTKSNNVAV